MPTDHPDSNIDLPASPFTIVRIDAGSGLIHTCQGPMSADEVAALLAQKIGTFDWTRFVSQGLTADDQLLRDYEVMLDIAALMAEVDLHRARVLWNLNAPPGIGVPRMLAETHEAQELRYTRNLAAQRGLNDDELASHILEEGDFMSDWAEARRQLMES